MNSCDEQSGVVTPHILIADNECEMPESVYDIFAVEKYNVTVYNPDSSSSHVLQQPYDVVILDFSMPKTDGFTLREEVVKYSPHAQFIVITDDPDPRLLERVTDLGIYGFLIKPFTSDQIKYTVMGALCMKKKLLWINRNNNDDAATKKMDLDGALQRIDAIINSMGEGLLAIDNDDAVMLMNSFAEKIMGMRFGECAGVRLEHCHVRREVTQYLLPRLAGTIVESEDTVLSINEGADVHHYSVNMQNIIDGSGKLTGRVVLFRDRTDAKHFETLRDSFLSVAAHELRTPITIMMNYICLLKKKDDDHEMRSVALGDMLAANRRMKYIVNSIINFITLSARDVPVYKAAVDVSTIIREEIKKLENETKEKNVSFEVTMSLTSPHFFSDSDLVTIAVYNVLNNAVKYNRENGTVRIDVKNKTINGEPGISIGVSDDGEGLSQQMASNLFEGFTQGEDHLTRIHGGLGTGLFIAQRAVKLLGGSLCAESLQDRGSRFSLEFPCSSNAGAMHTNTDNGNQF